MSICTNICVHSLLYAFQMKKCFVYSTKSSIFVYCKNYLSNTQWTSRALILLKSFDDCRAKSIYTTTPDLQLSLFQIFILNFLECSVFFMQNKLNISMYYLGSVSEARDIFVYMVMLN